MKITALVGSVAESSEIKQRKHASFSMVANKKRLDILKQSFAEIEFKVDDLMSAQNEPLGTKVTIRLPL